MVHLKSALILVCYLCSGTLFSQLSYENHELRSKGIPPADFKTDILFKSRNQGDEWKIADKAYLIRSSHFLNQILSSGKVLYGDTLTSMINRIADRLLKDDPELRKQLRFYTLRATVPNAMCLQQGVVLVTTGLIASFNNESELAFVISHEIAHYYKKHSLKSYKYKKELIQSLNEQAVHLDKVIKEFYSYSKENESEADEAGLKMFVKAGYSAAYAEMALKKLKHWDHFIDSGFTGKSFASDGIFSPEPDDYTESLISRAKKLHKIYTGKEKSNENTEVEEDEYSTHPSLNQRISSVKNSGYNQPALNNRDSLSYSYFRNLAVTDIAFLYYLQKEFSKSVYLLEFLNNAGIRENWISDLRMANIYRFVNETGNTKSENENNFEPEDSNRTQKTFYYLLRYCSPQSIYGLYNHCKARIKTNSSDDYYLKLAGAFIRELSQIKTGREFTDSILRTDSTIAGVQKEIVRDFAMKEVKKNKSNTIYHNEQYKPVNRIMLFVPNIAEVITIKKLKREYLKEARAQDVIYKAYKQTTGKLNLHATILDNRVGKDFSTLSYNRYARAADWMEERFSWDTTTPGYIYSNRFLNADTQLAGMEYFSSTMLNYVVHRRELNPYVVGALVIYYPTIPILIGWALIPQKDLFSLNVLINARTGSIDYFSYSQVNSRFSKDLIRAHVYKNMYNYKHGLK